MMLVQVASSSFFERAAVADPGVGHRNGERPKGANRKRNGGFDIRRFAHVACDTKRAAAGGFDFAYDVIEPLLVACEQCDMRPQFGQQLPQRGADSGGSAGDEDRATAVLSCKVGDHRVTPWPPPGPARRPSRSDDHRCTVRAPIYPHSNKGRTSPGNAASSPRRRACGYSD